MDDGPIKISLNQGLTWDRCRFLWKLKYIDKWEKTFRGHKMELGTMGHSLLFDFYKTGQDHSEEFAAAWLEDLEMLDGEQIQNIATVVQLFKLYREIFSPEQDRGLETLELEYHFEVPLTTPQGRPFLLEGYIDRMSRDMRHGGLLWVEDYKWTGKFWSPLEILMDPQLPLYAACLRTLGYPVHGLMVTQVNTYPYKGDNRSKKDMGDIIKRERFAVEPRQTDQVLVEYGRTVDEMIDNQEGDYRRSLRRECGGGKSYPCEMQEPCLMGLKGIEPVKFMAMSPDYAPRTPRPVDRQDGVPVPLQSTRTRLPEPTVEDQIIHLNL